MLLHDPVRPYNARLVKALSRISSPGAENYVRGFNVAVRVVMNRQNDTVMGVRYLQADPRLEGAEKVRCYSQALGFAIKRDGGWQQ
jgi:hypothetical protein